MAKRKNYTEARQLAYDLYMTTDKSQKDIAEIAGVSEQSVSKWKTEGNWEEIKLAHQTTRDQNIKQLHEMLKQVIADNNERLKAGELTAGDIDKQHKIAATIDKLSQDVPLRMYVQCFEDFIEFIEKKTERDFITKVMDLQYEFLSKKANA